MTADDFTEKMDLTKTQFSYKNVSYSFGNKNYQNSFLNEFNKKILFGGKSGPKLN